MTLTSEILVKVTLAYEDTDATERTVQDMYLESLPEEVLVGSFTKRKIGVVLGTEIVAGLVDQDGVALQRTASKWAAALLVASSCDPKD